jgi:hypothetical protein
MYCGVHHQKLKIIFGGDLHNITFSEKGVFIQCGFMILTNKFEKYVETRRGGVYSTFELTKNTSICVVY